MIVGLGCACEDIEEGLNGILGDLGLDPTYNDGVPACPSGYLWDGSQCYVSDVTPAQYQAASAIQANQPPVLSPITSNFIRDDTGAVYYLANGQKYWITDPEALTTHGVISWEQVNDATTASIPSGSNIGDWDGSILALVMSPPSSVAPATVQQTSPAQQQQQTQQVQQQQVATPITGTINTAISDATSLLSGNIAGIPYWAIGAGVLGLLLLKGRE